MIAKNDPLAAVTVRYCVSMDLLAMDTVASKSVSDSQFKELVYIQKRVIPIRISKNTSMIIRISSFLTNRRPQR
ncbi:MAG: hypothetical protein K2I10_01910 [Lachnospiraceae bacterium]|nr:hypothetical protein [Lachnospiraceae bacterium]